MSTVDGWNTTPNAYEPKTGREVKEDGTLFDVPGWREDLAKRFGTVSTANASTTLITNGSNYTGAWEDVSGYDSLTVAVKTDQNGYFEIQFSPDGVNQDSTLTRYYRTSQIEAPHRFTITRQYFRVVFYNNSGSDQTFLRLQCLFGLKGDLNAPIDSTLAQDFDSVSVRPTDFTAEVALGRRQGSTTWSKFGYNTDVDAATPEVLASFGGAFNQKLIPGETLDIVSTSANDASPSGTGVRLLVIFGVDANWDEVTEVVAMNGLSTVTTTNSFIGVNRMTIFTSGTADSNVGIITATATTSGNTMAEMPAGDGTTQQCLFYVPQSHQFLATWLYLNAVKLSGGGSNPDVTFKMFVYSAVVDSIFEVYRDNIDLSIETTKQLSPGEPFVVGEKSILWVEASTTANNTSLRGRFSGKLIRDADG